MCNLSFFGAWYGKNLNLRLYYVFCKLEFETFMKFMWPTILI
jgi:hypothetical protein